MAILISAFSNNKGRARPGTANREQLYEEVREIVDILKPLDDEVVTNILGKYSLGERDLYKLCNRIQEGSGSERRKDAHIRRIINHLKKTTTTGEGED